MNPQEEAADLIKNPLPITPEDRMLPTIIWNYDEQIMQMEQALADARRDREEALARALETGCMKNKQFVIEKVEIEGDRKADPDLLKSRFPKEFRDYVTLRTKNIKEDVALKLEKVLANVETTIHLGTADKVFGKKNVTLCSTKMVTTKYVVKKVE